MIEYLSLQKVTAMHADEIRRAVDETVASGWYLEGEAVKRFENHYAQFIGTRHCVGCGNGYDALWLILRACKELGRLCDGDEVIVPANTFIATILAITDNGLRPVFVEPRLRTLEIDDTIVDDAITDRTRAIMLVHLYGRCAYTEHIGDLCRQHNLLLLEDNAQAHGCTYNMQQSLFGPQRTGSLGFAAAHSFYPGKNLGALGDAGAVTTNDPELADIVHTLANYGASRKYVFPLKGRNSRLDEVQAAVLDVKLQYLDADNNRRKQIGHHYESTVNNPDIIIPTDSATDNVYHIFPILSPHRDQLQQYLLDKGIQTMIHYPIPPHKQLCYQEYSEFHLPITEQISNTELSLPCNPTMTDNEVETVAMALSNFRPKK